MVKIILKNILEKYVMKKNEKQIKTIYSSMKETINEHKPTGLIPFKSEVAPWI